MTKAQSVQALPQPRQAWGRVEWGNYVFQTESLAALSEDALPYIVDNYEESGTLSDQIDLAMDWPAMFEYERRGQLLGFSVRVQGELQGYAIYLLTTTLHCATTVHAISDVIFVAKPYRNGFMPVKFIKYCEDKLREAGAKVIYNYIKPGTAEHIFERMGQKQHEVLYVKVL